MVVYFCFFVFFDLLIKTNKKIVDIDYFTLKYLCIGYCDYNVYNKVITICVSIYVNKKRVENNDFDVKSFPTLFIDNTTLNHLEAKI